MFETTLNERQSRLDRLQVAAACGLILLGALFVYSATMGSEAAGATPLLEQSWFRQMVWYAAGLGAAVAVCFVDYHTLARWSFVFYWALVLLLLLVLLPG